MPIFKLTSWPPRIVFMGTPEFAVPVLAAVAGGVCRPVLVVTQPDKPKGRGLKTVASAVKAEAGALGIPVLQPPSVKETDFQAQLRAAAPDVLFVAAYGKILPEEVLAIPRDGCVNVHASLLPLYRGAAPINWAIVRGEKVTGITIQGMAPAMDAGDILLTREIPIGPDETAGELHDRLSGLGAAAALAFFAAAREGIPAVPQDATHATLAPILKKTDGLIDWNASAAAIHDRVRGLSPWPGAYTSLAGALLKIHRTRLAQGTAVAPAGTIVSVENDAVTVAAGGGLIDLLELQAEGGKRLAAAEFARGRRLTAVTRLNTLRQSM